MDNKNQRITSFEDAFSNDSKPLQNPHTENEDDSLNNKKVSIAVSNDEVEELSSLLTKNKSKRKQLINVDITDITENHGSLKNDNINTVSTTDDQPLQPSQTPCITPEDILKENPQKEANSKKITNSIDDEKHKERTEDKKYLSKTNYITSSKKTLLPGLLIALVTFVTAKYVPMDFIVTFMFDPAAMELQPEFLKNNINQIIQSCFYLIGTVAIFLSVKAKNQGRLYIYDNYVLHKRGFIKKTKILIPEIVATDIHWTPVSLMKNVGNLEISSIKKDIVFKHCPCPSEVEKILIEKRNNFRDL